MKLEWCSVQNGESYVSFITWLLTNVTCKVQEVKWLLKEVRMLTKVHQKLSSGNQLTGINVTLGMYGM